MLSEDVEVKHHAKFEGCSNFNARIDSNAFFFVCITKSVTLTSRSRPEMGMVANKTLDLYLPSYQTSMKSTEGC